MNEKLSQPRAIGVVAGILLAPLGTGLAAVGATHVYDAQPETITLHYTNPTETEPFGGTVSGVTTTLHTSLNKGLEYKGVTELAVGGSSLVIGVASLALSLYRREEESTPAAIDTASITT